MNKNSSKIFSPIDTLRKTYIEVDLNAITHNLSLIRDKIGRDKHVLFAVKADGYGHGAVHVSKFVEKAGAADIFGVSSPLEGIELREAGIKLPILNLGLILPCKETIDAVLDYDITQTIADAALAEEISKKASGRRKKAGVHLKIDTGMGRIGCEPKDAVDIVKRVSRLDNIKIEGIFSHFPESDNPDSDFTKKQIRDFKIILQELISAGINIPLIHFANSAAILNYGDSIFNTARPGIMAYGYMPSASCRRTIGIIPSMSFKSCIVFHKRVKSGTGISYGLTFTAGKNTNIATVPVGYGDGYNRFLSNKARVIIRGRTYPVAGRVCMDQIMIDLGDDEFPLGEEVILFGREEITVETLAGWIGTIPYEVTCGISKRVKRIYLPC